MEGLGRCSARCMEVPISVVSASTSIRCRTCRRRGRLPGRTLAKATDVSHFASFLALPQCQDRLEGRHSLPRIVPSVTTQLYMSPPWRRPPLADCPALSTAARSALVELAFSSLPRCVADGCLGSTGYATPCGRGATELSTSDRHRCVVGRRRMVVLVVLCGVCRSGRAVPCARRNSRRESHCLRLLKQKLRAVHLLSSAL